MTTLLPFLMAALLVTAKVWAADEHDHDEHPHTNAATQAVPCVREAEAHEHGHDDEEHEHGEDEHEHGEDEHEHNNEEDGKHGHEDSQASCISSAIAQQAGIVTAQSGPQTLHPSISVYGELVLGAEQLSHIRARFEGLIKQVQGRVGDKVKEGDLLAEIESNDSFKVYPVKAPISGTIIARHANKGEVTSDQVLFSIANVDTLWAELRIFPSQQTQVKAGQKVQLQLDKHSIDGVIANIVPVIDQPYALARLNINATHNISSTNNIDQNTQAMPGQWLEAHIEIASIPVAQAVAKTALQTIANATGVFIRQGDNYVFTPLTLGQSDDHYVEVLAGLAVNSEYVSQNSYLVKADIEKSTAEHEH